MPGISVAIKWIRCFSFVSSIKTWKRRKNKGSRTRSGVCTAWSTFGWYLWVWYSPLQWFRYQGRFRLPIPIQASKRELGAYTLLWGWPTLVHCKIQADTWFCCLDSLVFESIWVKVGLWFLFRSLLCLVRFPKEAIIPSEGPLSTP